mmetsp:Transcript_46717/g.133241  ORF Transcript_46717/g.133241 Transcript_46717/m.133241 type:complete len:323 (+) Transcript_46717:95-1063(+)
MEGRRSPGAEPATGPQETSCVLKRWSSRTAAFVAFPRQTTTTSARAALVLGLVRDPGSPGDLRGAPRLDQRGQVRLPAQDRRERPAARVAVALVPRIAPVLALLLQVEAEAAAERVAGPGRLAVDEEPRRRGRGAPDEAREGLHHEGRAEHQQEVAAAEVILVQLHEALRQLLPEEDNLRLHEISLLLPEGLPALLALVNGRLQDIDVHHDVGLRVYHVRAVKVAVRRDQLLRRQPGLPLQRVDVLGVTPEQDALFVEEANEVVSWRWLVVSRPHLLAQHVERVGMAPEVVELEDGLCLGKIEALQVVIKAGPRRPKIGNPS